MVEAGSRRSRTERVLLALSSSVAGRLTRYETLLVALAALLCARPWAAARPLWFDELFTFYISRSDNLSNLFRALPADGNPPLYYLLARVSMAAFGQTAFAVRLPSIIAFTGGALAVYFFVRRRAGPVFALFAMLALGCCGDALYGTEARPYALLLGFVGLTLVSWQAAAERKRQRLVPLIGVAAGIAGAVASHHYGCINIGLPLLFGEAVRFWKRRRPDVPMYGAFAVGLCMLAVTLPSAAATHSLVLNYVKESTSFWAKPGMSSILSYGNMVCLWLPPVFLALLVVTRFDAPGAAPALDGGRRTLLAHEVAAAAGLVLLVPVMIGLTWLATGYYMSRYAIGAVMGFAILTGLVAPLAGRSAAHATAAAALCIPLLGAQLTVSLAYASLRSIVQRPAVSAITDSLLASTPGQEPVVVASALTYMPEWWYAPPQLRGRLHYLADLQFAVRQPDFLPELSLVKNQPFVPSKVDDYREFVSTHDRFLLYCAGSPRLEWTLDRLKREGWSLRVLRTDGSATLYQADSPR